MGKHGWHPLSEQQQLKNKVPNSKVDDRTKIGKMVRIQNSRIKSQKAQYFCNGVTEPFFRENFFLFLFFFKKKKNSFFFVH